MKEDLSRPLYEDYKKQKAYRIWGTAVSGGRSYEHADRPLIIIGWMLIIIAIGFIGWLNPYSRYYPFGTVIICLILFFLVVSFYERKFLYRFGRFRMEWEDETLYPNEEVSNRCDKDGKFLKTEENLKAAKRSRRAFLVLFAGIIAAVLLYCFLWIGLSYTRVPSWHSKEIEEAWQIAQKYDYVSADRWGYVGGRTESGEDISDQDRHRLWEIARSLQWEYVYDIFIVKDSGHFYIGISTIFGPSKLIWCDDINTDVWPAKSLTGTVIQLDEHWFYMRRDDGNYY